MTVAVRSSAIIVVFITLLKKTRQTAFVHAFQSARGCVQRGPSHCYHRSIFHHYRPARRTTPLIDLFPRGVSRNLNRFALKESTGLENMTFGATDVVVKLKDSLDSIDPSCKDVINHHIHEACKILNKATVSEYASEESDESDLLCSLAYESAIQLCQIASDPNRKQKATWNDLQEVCLKILPVSDPPTDSHALAVALIFGVFALMDSADAKAAASALSTTVAKKYSHPPRIAEEMLRSFLQMAQNRQVHWNWNTITQFTRAFNLVSIQDPALEKMIPRLIQEELERAETCEWDEKKQIVAGILALACQLRPWSSGLSPLLLVQVATPLDFWHVAELVCQSHPAPKEAVEYLIDTALEYHTYRRADHLATNLYELGGRSRFVEARFQHACDTISRVVVKRQLPLIERQVLRIDQSLEKVQKDPNITYDGENVSQEVRRFALHKLDEAGNHEAALRLATLWEMDYVYDEEAMQAAAEERRRKYLQFEDVLSGPIPDVISSPVELRKTFETFWKDGPYSNGPFGLDAEWEADVKCVDLLQLSHPKQAILIDIPALASTPDGINALKETVAALFDSPKIVVAGFACRQDISRLRQGGWLDGFRAVVDIQPMVVQKEPKLAAISAGVGLARVCEFYFGKALDKSEQCSFWGARPLSEGQRSYAALDAWVCAAVYEKLFYS